MSTLQDSLYGTDCHLAPLTQRHTPAFTPPVARGMRSLLRGSLAITATGLSPASRHRLQDTPLALRPDDSLTVPHRRLCRWASEIRFPSSLPSKLQGPDFYLGGTVSH